jgi:hypothetical protein
MSLRNGVVESWGDGLRWKKFPSGVPCLSIRQAGSRSDESGNMPELQNHALDMRINVEGRWAQKTYECLVTVARQLDRKA